MDWYKYLKKTVQKQHWKHLFHEHTDPVFAYFQDEPTMQNMIENTGLTVITIDTVQLKRPFKNRLALESWLMGFMAGVPIIGTLSQEQQLVFTRDFVDSHIEFFGHEKDGSIMYRIPSLRIHAIKNKS